MCNGFYQMGIARPSKFTIVNNDNSKQETIELNGTYAEQMKQIAPLIQNNNITQIYVSNENAIPLEHMLNEILIKQYNFSINNTVHFIYRKVK